MHLRENPDCDFYAKIIKTMRGPPETARVFQGLGFDLENLVFAGDGDIIRLKAASFCHSLLRQLGKLVSSTAMNFFKL